MTSTQTVITSTEHHYIAFGQQVLDIELNAVSQLRGRIHHAFAKACHLMLHTRGHVIVTGMGKSGHIARKIAATLASTGTPAFYIHPGEANHGDLGMVTENDLVLAISNSGETQEILTLLPMLKRLGIHIVSMTGHQESTLAQAADIHLDVSVPLEACPLGLAPTSSTTVTLVMGDALAIALLRSRGFDEEDFARSHPGGALGRRLITRVSDIMHTGTRIPCISEEALIRDALLEISAKGLGMTVIINESKELQGIFTDGDLRRIISKEAQFLDIPVKEVMTRQCTTVPEKMLAAQAVKLMEAKKINALVVTNSKNKLVGVFNMHDVLNAKII